MTLTTYFMTFSLLESPPILFFVFSRKCFKYIYKTVFQFPFGFYHFLPHKHWLIILILSENLMPLFFALTWLLKPAAGTNEAETLL